MAAAVAEVGAARALRPAALAAAGVLGLAGFVALWAAAGAAVPARAAVPMPGPVAAQVALGGRQPPVVAPAAAMVALQPARPVQAPC